jgi:hypothetical protein
MNVFKSLCSFDLKKCPPRPKHTIFWVVLLGEFAMQQAIIWSSKFNLTSNIFGTAVLEPHQQAICYVIGAMSLPVNLIVKNVKVDKFAFIQSINLEKNEEKEFINRFMSKFEKAYSSLMGSIQKEEEEDSEDDIDQ